jgi:putative transcriptional regulator
MTATLKPTRHAPCHLLMRHAAGTLSSGMSILVESHLALCPACRLETQAYETEAGLALESLPPEALEAHCLENLLTKINESGPPACIDVTLPPPTLPDPRFPEPLRVLTGPRGELLAWMVQDGFEEARSPALRNTAALRLLKIKSARGVAAAMIHPTILLLVLDGILRVRGASYARGDILKATALEDLVVREEVLCLAVMPAGTDKPTWLERLMGLFCKDIA